MSYSTPDVRPWLTSCPFFSLHVLAVGLENGEIRLLSAPFNDLTAWTPYKTLDAS